jgi:D-alanine-D-alanine ligase
VNKRIRVAVIYGGKSSEHEVSLESAKCVLENLDPERFDVLPIAIDKQGAWHAQDIARLRAERSKALPVDASGREVSLASSDKGAVVQGGETRAIDVVFPVMHGPLCEDGSVQGLLELSDVAYVGAGVLGSAICMDKDVAKRLARAAGIPTVDYLCLRKRDLRSDMRPLLAELQRTLGYPLFVKPASLGSSVGVTRVEHERDLEAAVRGAFSFDEKVLIERAVDAREIELAVLEALDPDSGPDVSVPGEITPKGAFYSYEHKYLDPDGAALQIPARLEPAVTEEARRIARDAFVALECEGMARIDLFLDRKSGHLLFSEANTIPGFTTISMYPKLWEASGLSYGDLLARLIDLALRRQTRRKALRRTR